MTTQVGTFTPLHGQSAPWGSKSWNQHSSWNANAWNQTPSWNANAWNQTPSWNANAWNQTPSWNANAWNQTPNWNANAWNQNQNWGFTGWNPNTPVVVGAWNPNSSHNSTDSSMVFVPNYGVNQTEIGHAGAQLGFVPYQYPLTAGSFQSPHQTVGGLSQSLATELSENSHEYVISFDVPGIDIGDLDISLAGSTILINGVRKGSQDMSTLAYTEIARGNFSRAVAVPFDISPNKAINTSLENGVLKVRIAKEGQSDKKMTTRKVKIG